MQTIYNVNLYNYESFHLFIVLLKYLSYNNIVVCIINDRGSAASEISINVIIHQWL